VILWSTRISLHRHAGRGSPVRTGFKEGDLVFGTLRHVRQMRWLPSVDITVTVRTRLRFNPDSVPLLLHSPESAAPCLGGFGHYTIPSVFRGTPFCTMFQRAVQPELAGL